MESLAYPQRLFLGGPLHNQCKRQLTGLGLHSKEQNGVIPGIGDNGWKLLGIGGYQIEYRRMLLAGHLFAEMNQLIETVALGWICICRGGNQQQEVRGGRRAEMIAIARLQLIAQVVRTGRNGVATGIAGVLREMDNAEEKRRCKRLGGILSSFGSGLNLGRRPEVDG